MGIILSFAIPSVAKIIEDSKEKSFQNQLKFIEKAGEQYLLQNETELEWEEHPSNPEGKIAIIPLGRLQTEGSIQSPINNPKGGIFDPDETKF